MNPEPRRCKDCRLPISRQADRCRDCYVSPIGKPKPEPWDGIDEVVVGRLLTGEKVKATAAEIRRAMQIAGVSRCTIYEWQKAGTRLT